MLKIGTHVKEISVHPVYAEEGWAEQCCPVFWHDDSVRWPPQ
jgi:hypothetical protein